MTETQWTAKIVKDLRSRGILVRTIPGDFRGGNGWPDRLIVTSRGTFLVEFKGEETVVEKHQVVVMEKINKLNPCTAFVARKVRDEVAFYYDGRKICEGPDFLKTLYEAVQYVRYG